jgi:SAM-dependent methyltransferase
MPARSDPARERNRAVWEAGDWDQIAPHIAAAGARLIDALGDVGPGVRLLDIGTGSGTSVAIPAAARGAEVVGCDVTGAWFAAARERASQAGVEIEWVVGDAAELPFEDDSFDVVTSTFGHMFAPDQAAAARELVRVCRPGGTIGLCCWTPEGHSAGFFNSFAERLPPSPPGFQSPLLWGSEPHVRALLEPLGVALELRRDVVTLRFDSPEAQVRLYEDNFGPLVGAKAMLGDEWTAARAAIVDFCSSTNHADDGTLAADYEYLETIARLGGA